MMPRRPVSHYAAIISHAIIDTMPPFLYYHFFFADAMLADIGLRYFRFRYLLLSLSAIIFTACYCCCYTGLAMPTIFHARR